MGQTFELEPQTNGHRRPAPRTGPEAASLAAFAGELDDMRARVAGFPAEDPSDILTAISGIAGRLAEIRADLYRSNSSAANALRTREVDPLRDDLDLQFRIWSRKIAFMEWELKLSGGAP